MKPCKKCTTPLKNDVEICPRCGENQTPDVRVQNPPEEPHPPEPDQVEIWNDIRMSVSLIARSVLTSTLFAGTGGGIGYYFNDSTGLIYGILIGLAVKFVVLGPL